MTSTLRATGIVLLALVGCTRQADQVFHKQEWRYLSIPSDSALHLVGHHGQHLFILTSDSIFVDSLRFVCVEERYSDGTRLERMERRYFAADAQGNLLRRVAGADSLVAYNRDHWNRTGIPVNGISKWYITTANPSDSWTAYGNRLLFSSSPALYEKEIDQFHITLVSRNDTVMAPDGTALKCLRFQVDDIYGSDDAYEDWLAEGIGLVRRRWESSLRTNGTGFLYVGRVAREVAVK